MPSGATPGRHILRGSAWMIGLRWSLRLTGIVSTAILARLLTPGDFGVVALAMLFVGFVEILGDTGERLALIRIPAPDRSYYDTAFSLQLLIGLVTAVAVFALAPLSLHYFHEPRAVPVMRFLALRAVLSGLENIGTVDFRRDFRFQSAFALGLRAKLISLLATLGLALWTHSYWALAIGIVVNQGATTVFSYMMHPYRPRFSLARRQEIYGFSLWTLLRSVGIYLTSQIDQFAIGGFAATGMLGRYAVAMDVATSPTSEIHEPVVGVLYPVFSKCQHDRSAVAALFRRVFGWSVIICAATGAGLGAVAPDYCLLLLGPQWVGVAPLIPILAVAASLVCVGNATDPLFDTLGMPRWSATLQWMRLAVLACGIALAAILWRDTAAIAWMRLAAGLFCAPAILLAAAKAAGFDARAYLPLVWRPILSALVMTGLVSVLHALLPPSPLLRLAIEVPAGASAYAASLLLLWSIAKCPAGAEAEAFEMIRRQCGSLRAKWMVRAPSL